MARASIRKPQPIPNALRVFAWNLGGRLTTFGKKQIALNVIERGRAWHWTKLPKGWFDLKFCLAHGQKKTKQTLRELFPTERIEIASPYLRHRNKYQPSKHVPGLAVVSLADLMFAKVSAFSTRGFARDLIDLFAIDQQRSIDWQKLLAQAARASDNDYNPAEFLRKLQSHSRECAKPGYAQELPVRHPPAAATLRQFIERLTVANRAVAQATLKSKPTQR